MARYYFHMRDANGRIRDEEGVDLPDIEAARAEAMRGARSIIGHDVLAGRLDLSGAIEVVDEAGQEIHALAFVDAVSLQLPALDATIAVAGEPVGGAGSAMAASWRPRRVRRGVLR